MLSGDPVPGEKLVEAAHRGAGDAGEGVGEPGLWIASLIETCKLNGVDPLAYLTATLEAIAAGHPANRIDDLMPWTFSPTSS